MRVRRRRRSSKLAQEDEPGAGTHLVNFASAGASRRDLRFDTRLPIFPSARNGVLSQVAAGSASATRRVFCCNELRRSPREYRGTEMSEVQAWRLAGLIFGSWLGLILLDLAHQIFQRSSDRPPKPQQTFSGKQGPHPSWLEPIHACHHDGSLERENGNGYPSPYATRRFDKPQKLVVPLFQRPYVWNEENQWEPLWNDACGSSRGSLIGRLK